MKKPRRFISGALALCMLLLLPSCRARRAAEAEQSVAVGILRSMEEGDPDRVVEIIRRQERARMDAEREVLRQQLADGEVDVWSLLQDYVILGDSRAVGFYYYEFVPHERCLADGGDTIRTLEAHIPDIVALHPARIYIAYGVNDINIGFWSTAEEYTTEMASILGRIEEELPGIEIYVNSTLEVEDWALYKGDMWKYIPDWNVDIRRMCEENGFTFVDNAPTTAAHQELYDADGIHMQRAFYPYWAANMVLATYERAADDAFS